VSAKRLAFTIGIFFVAICACALDAPILGTPQNGAAGVPIPKLKLSWGAVSGAASYTVEVSTGPAFANKLPLEKVVVEQPKSRADVEYAIALAKPAKLLSGTAYFWRVTANCATGTTDCRPATSAPSRFITQVSTNLPFKLTQTVEGDNAKKPAQFKYAHSIDKGTIASADFAVQWRGKERFFNGHQGIFGLAYVEAVIKSNSKPTDTAVRPAVGFVHDFAPGTWSLTTHGVIRHESDQRFDTRKLLASVDITPSYKDIAMGTARPLEASGPLQFLWEPTLGLSYGRTVAIGDSSETNKTVERYSLRVDTVLFLNTLARFLNLDEVKLTFSDKGWLLPLERSRRRNIFSASINFPVADKVSVGFAFKRGKDAPEFKGTYDYGLTVGVQIGK
jgi:hypothetical protein